MAGRPTSGTLAATACGRRRRGVALEVDRRIARALARFPAHAQIFSDSEARKAILELRAKLAELQQRDSDLSARIDRLEAAQRNQLELANQTETLRQEIARLRGQVEALTNEVATLQKRNKDLYADLDARLKKMEPSNVTVDGRPVAVERPNRERTKQRSRSFAHRISKGRWRAFSNSSRAIRSRRTCRCALLDRQLALRAEGIQVRDRRAANPVDKYSDSTRAPDALLSIAESQLQLGDKRSANRTLTRLIKDYPESEAAKVARERLPATR